MYIINGKSVLTLKEFRESLQCTTGSNGTESFLLIKPNPREYPYASTYRASWGYPEHANAYEMTLIDDFEVSRCYSGYLESLGIKP